MDFLMDENILTNESNVEEDSQNIRTPNGFKNLNINSMSNVVGLSQDPMKKLKSGQSKVINNSKGNNGAN